MEKFRYVPQDHDIFASNIDRTRLNMYTTWLYLLQQKLMEMYQMSVASISECVPICLFRPALKVNARGHMSHLYGFVSL